MVATFSDGESGSSVRTKLNALITALAGGTTGQVLAKSSASDHDVVWQAGADALPIQDRTGSGSAITLQTSDAGKQVDIDENATVPSGWPANKWVELHNTDGAAAKTVSAGGSGTINGLASIQIAAGGTLRLNCTANAGTAPILRAEGETTETRVLAATLDANGQNITGMGPGSTGYPEVIALAVSDETTDLTTGTAKVTFRMPFAMTLSDVRASVTTAPTGAALIVDINEGGTTILSTKLSIDAGEKTSTTAATPPVISDTALADDAEITIDIDQIGSTAAGAGLKIQLHGQRS